VLPGPKFQIGAQAPGRVSSHVGIAVNSVGQGRAAYCPLPLASDYFKRGNSGAKYILGGLLNYVLPERTVEVRSDATLEVALAVRGDALIVHLLSYHAERRGGNPPVVEKVPRVRDIEVKVRHPRTPVRVVQEPEGRALTWEVKGGGAFVTVIPDMHIHTALVVSWS